MTSSLRITTYNIHKGFSQFNRRMVVHELREQLRALDSDIVFLQEVQGLHLGHARRHAHWPAQPQHEFLADGVWTSTAYGHNMAYRQGHHGNAILSRYPIVDSRNQDVTHLRFERRGLLHSRINLPGTSRAVHCVCVHLSLFGHSRRLQMDALVLQLMHAIPADAPLIIAGDFNDWRDRAADHLADRLGLTEVFGDGGHKPPRSYPAALPLLRLDRIYVRGFGIGAVRVHHGMPWSRISDHAALSATLQLR
ncbi:MAG: endonuclease/exonuclease/phosphatase family protein [Proteobacteria bacterium]|nr:endonuclease/exonuclease/phosphatase family protein [Pseudomonadota bacterium]HQR03870.1 endonuclease/exonuclease/phosphatase family protein [Rhodocyclaceae bacterium]